MMRFGRLLAEDSPSRLLEIYDKPNLESVFLHLCLSDDSERGSEDDPLGSQPERSAMISYNDKAYKACPNGDVQANGITNSKDLESNMVELSDLTSGQEVNKASKGGEEENNHTPEVRHHDRRGRKLDGGGGCDWVRGHRLRALLVKNFIRMWRNIGFLIFQFIIPTVQVSLFCLAIGRDPAGLTMAVVNHDIDLPASADLCNHFSTGCILGEKDDFMGTYDDNTYHKANLSCRFLSYIDREFVRPVYFDNLDDALESVHRGKHWGVMEFRSNYTNALYDRMFGMMELNR